MTIESVKVKQKYENYILLWKLLWNELPSEIEIKNKPHILYERKYESMYESLN